MNYDAVLFDFDGVVVETPSHRAFHDALERTYDTLGRSGSIAETLQELGTGDVEALAARCRALGVETDAFCARAAREMIRAQREEVERGLRAAYDDVTAVRSLEQPLGIVSDNHPAAISLILDRFGLRSLFETVYGCPITLDGLERRKPDPHNIETAMDELDAESALYVGDRSVDVAAADNAGIDSALIVRDGEGGATDETGATYRLTSLTQLPTVVG